MLTKKKGGKLFLKEDNAVLRVRAKITGPEVLKKAKNGKLDL